MADELQATSDEFETVEVAYVPGTARRKPAGGIAQSSGLLKLNVRSSSELIELARSEGHDPALLYVVYQVNKATRTVALHVVAPNTPNATPVRHNTDKRTYTLYLHSVYEQNPTLRPDGKSRVGVTRGTAKGRPALLIHLSGLAARSGKRESVEVPEG